MSDIFNLVKFKDLNVSDPFFNTLKDDYPGFVSWFQKKQNSNAEANILKVDGRIAAFLYLKENENESIQLDEKTLPAKSRIKIGTLKIDDSISGKRLGEGSIGIALWEWFRSTDEEIYVTVFSKHDYLINLLQKFGFIIAGKKSSTSEYVMIKNKTALDYSSPYKSFPYIDPSFKEAGLLSIKEEYHDKLFPYSQLQNVHFKNQVLADVAGNGITKIYVSYAYSGGYKVGEPLLIYRVATKSKQRGFKSAVTSIATVVGKTIVKENGQEKITFEKFKELIGNKTVLSKTEIDESWNKRNLYIYSLVYNYYFGAGNNVNYFALTQSGIWSADTYPTDIKVSNNQLRTLVRGLKGDIIKIIP